MNTIAIQPDLATALKAIEATALSLVEQVRALLAVSVGGEAPAEPSLNGELPPITCADIEPLRDHLTRMCGGLVRRARAACGGDHGKTAKLLCLSVQTVRNVETNYVAWHASRGETPPEFGPHDLGIYTESYEVAKRRFRIEHVALAVEVCGGNKSAASRLLGISDAAVHHILNGAADRAGARGGADRVSPHPREAA